ncbi:MULTISPECIES: tRNA lysidine(34) synthetase TilS [unclassified Spirosoma]|uniref:tRNA lysidine(34) synthetase TilS n=1 Tax=unclassified Spirosoma TaxID=2621999 RepID=UPI00096946B9|nr:MULTISPECIES: tRNA lysidine(34) synthetase TilS [unclassified Spirosoma]MBN8821180.1 tRNA lysidine(34) synthetase TilS [Spirosoma sp.]OJW79189.1 MAG: tRNA lysidine(34) synthetase TilS [Spirosoma sp. 48-14]
MLEQDFLAFINDNRLFAPTDRVLLAVSGGLDSMVMTELFHRIRQPFAIAHVNFGLRANESDADALFVKNKAEQYGVPFHLTTFKTAAFAAEKGISIQMAARELRYNWFAELLQQFSYACVATAHHQNDVLETLLLNLTRGTGLAGLHGIASRQNDVVRPLLFTTRDRLATYLAEQNLMYREDSSNPEDKYARNRIRHHVVPVLAGINPALWQTVPRTVERLRAAEQLMKAELNRSWQEIAELQGEAILLPTNKLNNVSELSFRLTEWLKRFGFTETQVEQMIEALDQEVGQVFLSGTHRVVHERAGLLLEPLPDHYDYEITLSEVPAEPILLPDGKTLRMVLDERPVDYRPSSVPTIACLDADKINFPLTIRSWRLGDRFRPLGLQGSKLVSDFLNDLKVTRAEREQVLVMLTDGQIAWVIGRRIDHRFRIVPETKKTLQLVIA